METSTTDTLTIRESSMDFGPFLPTKIFHIEKSTAFSKLGEGFSTVEFVYLDMRGKLIFVEAKFSMANPQTNEGKDFDENILEVTVKFEDAYQLFLACYLERRDRENMSQDILNSNFSSVSLQFILVIKGHQIEWLGGVRETLKKNLRKTLKMWNIDLQVLNEELAKNYGLVT